VRLEEASKLKQGFAALFQVRYSDNQPMPSLRIMSVNIEAAACATALRPAPEEAGGYRDYDNLTQLFVKKWIWGTESTTRVKI
jgi:hypothetical protein